MVIVDEKSMHPPPLAFPPPPPPYLDAGPLNPPPFPNQNRQVPTLCSVPPHILLAIVYMTFPQVSDVDQGRLERQRKTLYWLSVGLRLVNRSLYTACMHVLRSTYLPAYNSLIRPPYSSDPFPLAAPASSHYQQQPVHTLQRETNVLDLFIALKVREDVWMDDSELHLEREESFKDLFDLNQPRSRLEDLVRIYGTREDVVTATSPQSPSYAPGSSGSPTAAVFRANNASSTSLKGKKPAGPQPLLFSSLSVSFSPRRVGLVLTSGGRKRTIVEVGRTREEKLEVAAKKLVKELKIWLG